MCQPNKIYMFYLNECILKVAKQISINNHGNMMLKMVGTFMVDRHQLQIYVISLYFFQI